MTAAYSYWLRALVITEGKRQLTRDEMKSLGISEDAIGCGFFRVRPPYAGTGPRPGFERLVAIWESDGALVATVDGVEVPADEVWLSACKMPITEASYRAAIAGEAA